MMYGNDGHWRDPASGLPPGWWTWRGVVFWLAVLVVGAAAKLLGLV